MSHKRRADNPFEERVVQVSLSRLDSLKTNRVDTAAEKAREMEQTAGHGEEKESNLMTPYVKLSPLPIGKRKDFLSDENRNQSLLYGREGGSSMQEGKKTSQSKKKRRDVSPALIKTPPSFEKKELKVSLNRKSADFPVEHKDGRWPEKRKGEFQTQQNGSQRNLKGGKSVKSKLQVEKGEIIHSGGCHCGAVRFKLVASPFISAIDCNCSICKKKQNIHFIVPQDKFQLLQGEDMLTTYTFNTHQAKHMFCKVCGVQSFYRPRSNPDGYGVMPHCLDPETVKRVDIEYFDGNKWEVSITTSDIPARSKAK